MTTIREGRVADYPAVMDRCAESFAEGNPTHLRFEELGPDSILPTATSTAQWLLAEEPEGIVAGLQVVPRPMILAGDVRLQASGLANVFCIPSHRKRGHMSALLEAAIARMQAAGDAVNLLGGDRLRYGHYGWENAGTARALSLGGNMLRGLDSVPVSVTDLRRWLGDPADTRRMFEAYSALPYRTRRGRVEFARVLRRPGQVIWIRDTPADGFAYASLTGGAVAEYAGSRAALDHILRYVVSRRGVQVSVPPVEAETDLERLLLSYAAGFSVNTVGMLRIVSLERTLEAYGPLLARRLAGWRGRFALGVQGGETVLCEGTGRRLQIRPGTAPDLALGRQDLARLLFGPFPPDLGPLNSDEFVRRALPLPIYWHALSHV